MRRQTTIAIVQLILATQLFMFTSIASAQTKKVACVGDSITAPANGWCRYLGMKLGSGYMAQTFGVSGTTLLKNVGQPAFSSSNQYKPSHDFAPDIVVIMLGTNDSMPRNWDAGKDHFVKDYEELIDSYTSLATKPLVILNTAPPASNDNMFSISGTNVEKEINPLIKQVAMTKMCPVADVWAAFGGDVSKLDSFDGVHPGDSGQMVIADTVAKVIMMPVVPGGAAGAAGSAAGSGGSANAGAAGSGAQAGANANAGGAGAVAAMGGASGNPGGAGTTASAAAGAGAVTSPSGTTGSNTLPRVAPGAAGMSAPGSSTGTSTTTVNPVMAAGSGGAMEPVNPEPASGCGCRVSGNSRSKSGLAAALVLLIVAAIRGKSRRRAPLKAATCDCADWTARADFRLSPPREGLTGSRGAVEISFVRETAETLPDSRRMEVDQESDGKSA